MEKNNTNTIVRECSKMLKEDIDNELKESIGLIRPFLAKPNPYLWLKCDGALLDVDDIKNIELYKKIGKYYNQFLSISIPESKFALPLIGEDLGQIMCDETGLLDKPRDVNTDAKWAIPKSVLSDFNLSDQKQMVKNGLYDDSTDGEVEDSENDSTPFTVPGSDVVVVQKYNDFELVSKDESNPLRLGEGLKFEGIYVTFYIKWRNYTQLSDEEKIEYNKIRSA